MALSPNGTLSIRAVRSPSTNSRKSHHEHNNNNKNPIKSHERNTSIDQAHATAPMFISSLKSESPPPPLPPPRYIEGLNEGQDAGWHFANRNTNNCINDNNEPSPGKSGSAASVRSGSSLLGGHRASPKSYTGPQRSIDLSQAESSQASSIGGWSSSSGRKETFLEIAKSTIPDLSALSEYTNRLKSEKHMGQRFSERSSHAYDKHVLSRIGGPHTPPRSAGGVTSAPNEESSPSAHTNPKQLNGQLHPFSMLERRHSATDHPQFTSTSSSALSPTFPNIHSPLSESGMDPIQPRFRLGSMSAVDDLKRPRRDSDTHMFGADDAVSEDPGVQELNINDRSSNVSDDNQQAMIAGKKRRAQSPPSETIDPSLRDGESSYRAQPPSDMRPQQAAKLHESHLIPSSLTSAPRNSFSSSYQTSHAPSTAATSYQSEHMHPSLQKQDVPQSLMSDLQPSPEILEGNNAPMSSGVDVSTTTMSHVRTTSSGLSRSSGVWICECCPKKPKKFESEEALRVHEMEKQYVCQYCHNRFKNKNEAERHQNSLHLRRHSWSCAALSGFEAAFHATSNNMQPQNAQQTSFQPTLATDTCGYCGTEFPNPPDWEARYEHVNHVHKFGECNQTKKFFRADHFRQHLKHSHAGQSGKWTNMLENACMKDEPPPQPIHHMNLTNGMTTDIVQQPQIASAPIASMTPQSNHLPPRRLSNMREEEAQQARQVRQMQQAQQVQQQYNPQH